MILQYRNMKFQLSRSDYQVWLNQWKVENIEKKNNHEIINGRCCFCSVFRMERRGRESSCTECPLSIFGVEGKDRIEGCLNLIEDILGPKNICSATSWGLIFTSDFTVVVREKGRASMEKIKRAIEGSIIDGSDSNGEQSYFGEIENEKEGAAKTESQHGETQV